MARLPYSRVVDVTLTRQDRFAVATGFSVALIVQPEVIAGILDADHRTKLYSTLLEVAADFDEADAAYKAAAAMFAQNPRPRQIKLGYRNAANSITSELNAIYAADSDFYWLGFTAEIRDTISQQLAADWAETKPVLAGLDSNDISTESPAAEPDKTSTVTISIASPGVVTWNAHGLQNGDQVVLTTSGALPTGMTAGTTYYVVNQATNTFQLATTPGGSAVTTTGTQSGTHTATSPQFGGSIAEYIKSKGYDRSFVFYHTDATLYGALAMLAYASTRDLDRGNLLAAQRGDINSGNAYTVKFKKLAGITPLNKSSAVVQAITGFVPGLGLNPAQGHFANTYVDIGGLPMVVEGSVGSAAFIDEIHASDWIVARMQEALLSTLANNARVPYTNPGVGMLTNTVDGVMRRAVAAGVVAADFADDATEIVPEYTISVDRVENIPASQRRNRIAPDIKVDFRYAGAIHYASASITLRF
ncbi:hypothetical protein ASE63_22410 [Bosea sp. Root381]|uniref:DUF3383 family protein n=1 Tax=Bosea sp. Root381 TaxID=1736524 RepID=UPI000700B0A3|nr:DUF3383 family protein [Bosea sp. Root381]KRE07455.1 hypothetical protein ASE63_22410 [Bosea sp. Root381]